MREVIKALEIPCYALPSDTLLEDETMISNRVDSDYGSNESSRENSNFFEIQSSENHCNSLFVFPALCNFSGKKYPMQWISSSQSGKLSPHLKSEFCVNFQNRDNDGKSNWYCLLDAASYVATNPLGENPDTISHSN
jgi:molybdenum cofactor sulfurtransferase